MNIRTAMLGGIAAVAGSPKDSYLRARAAAILDKSRRHLPPDGTGNRCSKARRKAKCPKRGRLYWSARP